MTKNYLGRGAEYVNKLYAAVERNLTLEHEFICFTDDPTGINCDCLEIEGTGWFSKLFLFKKFNEGKVIYFDLDTLIVDNINFLDKYNGNFAILRDFYRVKGYGSGVMIWKGGWGHHITDSFVEDGCPNVFGGDQIYIEQCVKSAKRLQDLFPHRIVSYKEHAMTGIPHRAAVICFHGYPKPHDFSYAYVNEEWHE